MSYEMPNQPKGAIFEPTTTGTSPTHYLSNLLSPGVPYSKNKFLLAELATEGGQLPVAGLDVVIFHYDGVVVCMGLVTAVIDLKWDRMLPGYYRTLVSCVPMTTAADVPVHENLEADMVRELVWTQARLDANKSAPATNGNVPKGARMQNQQRAAEIVWQTLALA